jgi:hypothetical protein
MAAGEAAKVLADEWPNADATEAIDGARAVARDHGVAADDLRVRIESVGRDRGDDVRVNVSVRMPALSVMGIHAGEWQYEAVATRRIDDYRSR